MNIFKNKYQDKILLYTINYNGVVLIFELVIFAVNKLILDFVFHFFGARKESKMLADLLIEKYKISDKSGF